MFTRRTRRRLSAAGVFVLAVAAVAAGGLMFGGATKTAVGGPAIETEELPALLAQKLATAQTFAPPGNVQEGERGADDEWVKLAAPGDSVPAAAVQNALADWKKVTGRASGGKSDWKPLGPTDAQGLPNQYRNRGVYNAGTPDFSGRIAHVAIDPNCRANGQCTLWIANANGGVWRTNNALDASPNWQFVSTGFEHQNTASIELDPNDKQGRTLYVGTGEPNACGSGCEAGVGIYYSNNAGNTWVGPLGRESFNNRAVGSIAVKPGDSKTVFAASGRAVRGVSNVCCGGVDALIPGAPHFGLYRSTNGGESWQLVHQGAPALCTDAHPDLVSIGLTPCSPRGARRVMIDPVDPNTVYASFFARGIWRSRQNGAPGTWELILARIGPAASNNERPEFDVVELPNGETRMYAGVGGGGVYARFLRNNNVRTAAAATVAASWTDLTDPVPNTPGYSSFGFCDGQCSYDSYVYVPPGAGADTVYLSGANQYGENDFVTGRSNGRAVLVSTNAGATFTDMTDDTSDQIFPFELHPDHHALVTNPQNWKQFFDVGDGGIVRSNGNFVDDSGDCSLVKGYTGDRLTFCQLVTQRVPERLESMNKGLRTLHFYQIAVSPHDPDIVIGGTQDNGSWERTSGDTWVNTNIADGGHNNFDIADPNFRQTAFQQGQLMVTYDPRNQEDVNWVSDTMFVFYGAEAVAFIGPHTSDPTHAGWLWTARQHVFRSQNYGRNPVLSVAKHRQHCSIWTGDGDIDEDGTYEPATDLCDDFKPLGDPGAAGRLTGTAYGAATDKVLAGANNYTAVVERAPSDGNTLWAATSGGRIFVSKNADAVDPATVVFDRIDNDPTPSAATTPARYPTAIYVDPEDENHAWVTFSGFNAKTPSTPGHVFEVRYAPNASTFTVLDGTGDGSFGDIPATAIVVTNDGTVVVGTDYGAVSSSGDGNWEEAGKGLPHVVVADLVYVPSRDSVYAGTHGQGAWALRVK